MSSLIVRHDSRMMMLEFAVEKLFVPSNSPFDAVIMSKYIVSFRFLDDEWIDVTPNRLDYKQYRGSQGTEQLFHGGKSLVISVPSSFLDCDSENLSMEIRARREISRYFETEKHIQDIGSVLVSVDELLNGIVAEMRLRRELGDYLALVHERDPISRSMKGTFALRAADDSLAELELYLRLSYLGSSVVTEIDKPSSDPFFYAQEETNLGESSRYECRELDTSAVPTSAPGRPIFSAKLECVCTDEQKYALLQPEGTKTQATTTAIVDVGEDDGKKKKKGKKVKKRAKEKGTSTEPETADKAIGTRETKGRRASRETKDKEDKDAGKQQRKELTDAERMRLIRSKRRGGGGGGTVGIVDRSRKTCVVSCSEAAAPACYSADICITKPACLSVCPPAAPEPAAVCCYN
ncbi:hypothetical protein TSAR_007844 [Trichomalopsis sarcophagae]|uniref:Uncharacterized protein n=1 Tax=Trichomalopsis sarcophagae TaxID=543379 RepID=A0A232FNZ7_9HYME|nr:hypothetical protein TSAR_007844 [Trichomalopsis sarcophagae]